jgi:hypothetical protein
VGCASRFCTVFEEKPAVGTAFIASAVAYHPRWMRLTTRVQKLRRTRCRWSLCPCGCASSCCSQDEERRRDRLHRRTHHTSVEMSIPRRDRMYRVRRSRCSAVDEVDQAGPEVALPAEWPPCGETPAPPRTRYIRSRPRTQVIAPGMMGYRGRDTVWRVEGVAGTDGL